MNISVFLFKLGPKPNAAIAVAVAAAAVGAISSQYMGTGVLSFVGGAHFDLSLDPPWPWPVAPAAAAAAAAQRWFIGLD